MNTTKIIKMSQDIMESFIYSLLRESDKQKLKKIKKVDKKHMEE